MSDISKKVASVKAKLAKVHRRLDDLNEENQSLRLTVSELERRNAHHRREFEKLQVEYDRLKLAKTLVSTSGDKAEMKFKVNELVREIDKCIALLNR